MNAREQSRTRTDCPFWRGARAQNHHGPWARAQRTHVRLCSDRGRSADPRTRREPPPVVRHAASGVPRRWTGTRRSRSWANSPRPSAQLRNLKRSTDR